MDQQKVSDDRLHQSAGYADEVLRTVPGIIWEVHGSPERDRWQVGYVGEAAERILGHRIDAWYNRRFWPEVIHPADRPALLEALKRLKNEEVVVEEFRWQKPDGSWLWLESRIVPIVNARHRPVGFRGISTDLSQRFSSYAEMSMERFKGEGNSDLLLHMAFHDSLTGLPNRILLQDRLDVSLHHAKRKMETVAVLFLDLDRFKNVNDTLGHQAGDLILKEVAKRLIAYVREEDTVARFGGDEFVIVLSDIAELGEVEELAKKILKILAPALLINGEEVHVNASIGIATFPNDGETSDTLLKNADNALYQAKEAGRNNYKVYTPAMHLKASAKMLVENGLRKAIEHGELRLCYQPIVSLKDGRIISLEALLRWEHPLNGIIMPEEFIPLAEETGIIVQIGEWVIETAVAQAVAWRKAGFELPVISVNISPRQFSNEHFLEFLTHSLKERRVNPAIFQLELTESVAMENIAESITRLRFLKDRGFRVAIDDFGSGYSSLSYLKQLPLDFLKIDKSFTQESTGDARDETIAQAIIALGHTLHLEVCAEGIETCSEYEFFKANGCDAVQGFYICRPQPAEEIGRKLGGAQPIANFGKIR
ncbi:EAL domain-containing protein [Patescibacteria group bacterium]|nr:EAL domain-containing protein [Patescibacteria group bacterium]